MSFSEECLTAVSPVTEIKWANDKAPTDSKIMLASFFGGLTTACFDDTAA